MIALFFLMSFPGNLFLSSLKFEVQIDVTLAHGGPDTAKKFYIFYMKEKTLSLT